MTKILELEVERRSLLQTVSQMSRGCDARMEVGLNAFLTSLEVKAKDLQFQINELRNNEIKEIAHRIWLEAGSPDGELLIDSYGEMVKLKDIHWRIAETEWTYGPDYLK